MARSRAPRVLRGLTAASVATFIALLSHVTAGGAVPGWVGVLVPWVLAVAACTLLAGRSLSFVRLAIAVGVSQFLFHGLFVLGFFTPEATTSAVHIHPGMHVAGGGHVASAAHGDAVMWFWHVAAALVTVAALHRGEHAVRRLLALAGEAVSAIRRRLVILTAVVAPAPRPLAGFDGEERVMAPLGWHPSSMVRRGPPLLRTV